MSLPRRRSLLLLFPLALATGCATSSAGQGGETTPAKTAGAPADEAGIPTGAQASDFTLRDIDGKDVRLSDFSGQVVLLDFWATWCVPCEAMVPHMIRLHNKYREQGFSVVGVAIDGPESVAGVAPAIRRMNVSYPVVLDEETKVVAVYNPKRTAPLTVLIDRQGIIRRVRQGFNVGDERVIEEDIVKHLGK